VNNMTIQSVPLSSLQPPSANPRTSFDAASLDGLAASIRTDGLLQNLVVAPLAGKARRYRVISGERRLRALKLLEKRGDIKPSFPVPVEIRSGLSKDDTLRLATIENLQREDLPPLDQAAALAALIRKGTTLDDLVAKTGLGATTIRRRLALNGLCEDAAQALREGVLTLGQAEALTLGDPATQRDLLERIAHSPDDYSPSALRECLLEEKPSVAMAIFPRERYTGTITTDLFQAAEESFFDDAGQFMALQREAVAELARGYDGKAAWVEVTDAYRLPEWQYEKATKRTRKHAGVVINLSPRGAVEVREGLVRPKRLDPNTAADTVGGALAAKPKPVYPAPLRRYIGWHKTLAVQEVLLADARKAREVAAVRELLRLEPHGALRGLAAATPHQVSYEVIEQQAGVVLRLLDLEPREGDTAWQTLATCRTLFADAALQLYRRVKQLSDAELDQLRLLIAVLPFGQADCEHLDAGESLFNEVAIDLKVDMRNHWRPDAGFLNRRTREQLAAIARDCGCTGVLASWKKSELVNAVLHHVELARKAAAPTAAQQQALAWLPEAMAFPAVDPDGAAGAEDAARDDDEPPFDVDTDASDDPA
jgi:ParB family transcriptional regulator, chromosome partitioning protein